METNAQKPDIFTRLGMASATDEQKQQLADQLAELTMVRVMTKLSEQLPEAAMAELESLVDAGDQEAIDTKIRSLVPHFDELVSQTAEEAGDQLVLDQQAVLSEARQQC